MSFWAEQKGKHGAFKVGEILTKISDLSGLPWSSGGKESACNVEDLGSIPGWEDPLEEGMATHYRILARRIKRIEEPGGLQSMGSMRWTQLTD